MFKALENVSHFKPNRITCQSSDLVFGDGSDGSDGSDLTAAILNSVSQLGSAAILSSSSQPLSTPILSRPVTTSVLPLQSQSASSLLVFAVLLGIGYVAYKAL